LLINNFKFGLSNRGRADGEEFLKLIHVFGFASSIKAYIYYPKDVVSHNVTYATLGLRLMGFINGLW